MTPLYELRLSNNRFFGDLPTGMMSDTLIPGISLQPSIRTLDLSNNTLISGTLPEVAPTYTDLAYIDLSGTSIEGDLRESWRSLIKLQQLRLHNTQLRCHMSIDENAEVRAGTTSDAIRIAT